MNGGKTFYRDKIRLLLAFSAFLGLALLGCAHKKRRWLLETPLQDVVSHTFLEAMGVAVVTPPERIYDEELLPFVQQFIDDAKKRGVMIPETSRDKLRQVIYVERLSLQGGPGVMAACNRYNSFESTLGGRKQLHWMTIEVLRRETQEYVGTDDKRLIRLREVLYHELCHCLLNKGHLPDGWEGIMSPIFTKGNQRSLQDWEALVDEMFSPKFLAAMPDVE